MDRIDCATRRVGSAGEVPEPAVVLVEGEEGSPFAAEVRESRCERPDAMPVDDEQCRRQIPAIHGGEKNISSRSGLVEELLEHAQVKVDLVLPLLILEMLLVNPHGA